MTGHDGIMMTESSALAIAFSGYVNNPMLA
ncbi:uncharacterized protein METZ01_LOCUS221799 [marine metagenome]|uniref:Uncharacterized protein n=1 Tax=marine metagenome TaxID=408172 RepID=A0A382G2D0_9ZZZZ